MRPRAQLNFEGDRLLTAAGFITLASACTALMSLNVHGVSLFNDSALAAFAGACRHLRVLQLSSRLRVSSDAIGDGPKIGDAGTCTHPSPIIKPWCLRVMTDWSRRVCGVGGRLPRPYHALRIRAAAAY